MINTAIQFIQNKPDVATAIVAVVALIISSLSIILALASVSLQRKHNRQSVKAIGEILLSDYEDSIAVKLRNQGLGPLIIDKVEVIDNKRVISDNLIDCMPDLPTGIHWSTFTKALSGHAITPSEAKTLLELSGNNDDPEYRIFRDGVRMSLSKLTLKVHYKDIYKKKGKCEKSLEWFGRHFDDTENE